MSTVTNIDVADRSNQTIFVAPIGIPSEIPTVGFFGATPQTTQPAGAAMVSVATTAATSTSPFGFTSAQANALIAGYNEIVRTLVLLGLHKGSA